MPEQKKQSPKSPTVKNSDVRITQNLYDPKTKTVIKAGTIVKNSDVKHLPDNYKSTK
jgi:hypothetical protein